jgi:hypothetical protein
VLIIVIKENGRFGFDELSWETGVSKEIDGLLVGRKKIA